MPNVEGGEAAKAGAAMTREAPPEELAYNGKILNVRLSEGESSAEELPDQMYKDYLDWL